MFSDIIMISEEKASDNFSYIYIQQCSRNLCQLYRKKTSSSILFQIPQEAYAPHQQN